MAVIGVTALTVFLLLVVVSVPSVLAARETRLAARTPVARPGPVPRLLELRGDDYVGGRLVRRLAVGFVGPSPPVPPGVTRLPARGQSVVSPALRALLLRRSVAGSRPRYGQIVGVIGSTGLEGPEELFAYVGVPVEELKGESATRSVVDYGVSAAIANSIVYGGVGQREQASGPLVVVSALLVVSLALAVSISVRLSSASRDLGWAALRLAGGSARQVQRVVAIETVSMSGVGSLLGLGCYLLARTTSGLQIGAVGWFAGDVHPGPLAAVVVAGVPILALKVAQAGARRAISSALVVRRGAPVRMASAYRIVPIVVGFVGATSTAFPGLWPTHLRGTPLGLTALLFALLVTAFLPLALPVLVRGLAGALAGRTKAQSLLLAGRRLQFDPASATRVVVSIGVIIVAAGLLRSYADEQGRTDATVAAGAVQPGYSVITIDRAASSVALASQLRTVAGVRVAVPFQSFAVQVSGQPPAGPDAISGTTAWVMDCRDAFVILRGDPTECAGRSSMWLPGLSSEVACRNACPPTPVPVAPTRLALISRQTQATVAVVPSPSFTSTKPIARNIYILPSLPDLLISPDTPGVSSSSLATTTTLVVVTNGRHDVESKVRDAVGALSPLATVTSGPSDIAARLKGSSVRRATLSVGGPILLLVALATFLITSLDAILERRRNAARLLVVGIKPKTLRISQSLYLMGPLVLVAAISLLLAILDQVSYSRVANAPPTVDWRFLSSLALLLIATGGIITIASVRMLRTAISSELLRTE
jgi:hypothetical protein